MNKKNKQKSYIIAIVIILVIAIMGFFLVMFNSTKIVMTNDPATIALTQTDIFNIPQGLVYNSSISESTYKIGNYWPSESEKQTALNQGFTNGYFDNFFYQDSGASNIEVIGSSISIYNHSAQDILNNEIQEYNQAYGCISFNLPTIGDYSYGCHMVTNISNYVMSYYEVFFYKGDVTVRTWVAQNQLVDLSADVVPYANIIANRL